MSEPIGARMLIEPCPHGFAHAHYQGGAYCGGGRRFEVSYMEAVKVFKRELKMQGMTADVAVAVVDAALGEQVVDQLLELALSEVKCIECGGTGDCGEPAHCSPGFCSRCNPEGAALVSNHE